jgi:phage terminase small subunit
MPVVFVYPQNETLMARPRKPTELLELAGAFRKDPQRARPVGPKSQRPLGAPPKYFSDGETECWSEIIESAAAGVLTSADRFTVELLARLLARFRADWLTGAEMSQMTWCCSHLGMTPADRSKVMGTEAEKEESPFDEFLN